MQDDPLTPALYLVELKVSDWPGALRWYEETLGLTVVLKDEAHGFALLEAGAGRVALKADATAGTGSRPFRLTFQVDDVGVAEVRLRQRGVEVSPPTDNPREGYRAIRLTAPEGTPITLFQWLRSPETF